jgi:hypothetical protein
MHIAKGIFGVASVAVAAVLTCGCGPLRLDSTPHIRGMVTAVAGTTVAIKHKTGRTYRVEVTPETKVINSRHPGVTRLCPGQRSTVFLVSPQRLTAASITVWSGGCEQ